MQLLVPVVSGYVFHLSSSGLQALGMSTKTIVALIVYTYVQLGLWMAIVKAGMAH